MNERVTFWASAWRPDGKSSHGEAVVSPSFNRQADLTAWIRERAGRWEQISAYKRTHRGGADFYDTPLFADDDIAPDPARLRALIGDLKDMLERKKRELDRPGVKVKARQPGAANPIARPLTYHEVYEQDEEVRA